jgi:hypothetical protein
MRSSSRLRQTITLNAVFGALLFAFACEPVTSIDSTLDGPDEIVVIEVEPSNVTIRVGETVQLTAVSRGQGDKANSGGSVLWSSSDPGVAPVSGAGLVTGKAEGTATISAAGKGQDKHGQAASATIRVEGRAQSSPSGLIIGLEPATYDTARLVQGDRYYVDRDFTLTEIPAAYDGWLWVRTANEDKAVTAESFVSFDLSRPGVVSVAYDRRVTSLPQWLRDWTEAPEVIGVSDGGSSPLRVFHKAYPAGKVTLGGNLASGASGAGSNYVVLLLEESRLEAMQVRVSPASVSLDPGATQQFSARVEDQVGNEVAASIEWSATGGAISAEGLYTAGDVPGNYRVIARDKGYGIADTAEVSIVGPTGALQVSTSTSGSDLDPNGYSVIVDGSGSRSIGINDQVTLTGLPPGDHSVELGGVASNCGVNGSNPRTVNVQAGGTASVAFTVTCTATGGGGSGDYYVDVQHPNASDSNPGTEELPWKTLYRAAEVLQAGDTVLVKAGTYVAQEGCSWSTPAINPSNSGTATQPIVFRAYPGHNVVVTNSVTDHGCPPLGTNRRDYIVIDGFEVDVPASKGVVVFHSTGTVIQNNVIHGMRGPGGDNTDGIRVEDSNAITLRNNVIYDIRNGSNTLNAAAVKIYYSSGVVVEHNEVYGLVAGLRNKAGGSDNVFRYNWVHDCEMKAGLWEHRGRLRHRYFHWWVGQLARL